MKRGKDYAYDGVSSILSVGRKVCTECYIEKPLTDFSKQASHPTGYKASCRECNAKRFAAWRKRNIEEVLIRDRLKHYTKKYGLSLKDAAELLISRVGLCEICKQSVDLVVDHNHDTKHVRGRICASCNSVLGYAKDSPEILLAAIEYLQKYQGGSNG